MSEELATISADTDGNGAGVVFGFIVGGIVATVGLGTAALIKNYGGWKAKRELKRNQEVTVVEVEKTAPKKS